MAFDGATGFLGSSQLHLYLKVGSNEKKIKFSALNCHYTDWHIGKRLL